MRKSHAYILSLISSFFFRHNVHLKINNFKTYNGTKKAAELASIVQKLRHSSYTMIIIIYLPIYLFSVLKYQKYIYNVCSTCSFSSFCFFFRWTFTSTQLDPLCQMKSCWCGIVVNSQRGFIVHQILMIWCRSFTRRAVSIRKKVPQ